MQNFILLLSVITFSFSSFSQGLYYPVSLDERAHASDVVVEAEVIQSKAMKGEDGMIFTHHQLRVIRQLKGKSAQSLEIITLGGTVDNLMLSVTPGLQLAKGDKGIFFLRKTTGKSSVWEDEIFKVYADQQGFVRKTESGTAKDLFTDHGSFEEDFVPQLLKKPGFEMRETAVEKKSEEKSAPASMPPSILSFEPDTIAAGDYKELTISGVGFGSYTGQATIEFRNADDGGISFVPADVTEIISWSDTKIVVQVPYRAGTGTFKVVDQNGSASLSSTEVVIPYDIQNLTGNAKILRPRLVDANTNGGLTFVYNNSFLSNDSARSAFERALENWRCNTFVNFSVISSGTDSICQGRNDFSVVSFDNNCQLDPGVLGRAFSYYNVPSCPDNAPQLVEVDIVFDAAPPNGWHFGSNPPPGFEQDFESVALHELGHAHQLGHVIDPNAVMHYNLPAGTARKNLSQNDIEGGNSIMERSTVDVACGNPKMIALTSGNCQFTSPVANFGADPTRGCVDLEVQFTDLSTSNPSSWSWDFQNDGTIDATVQNPTFTYTNPGIYSVRLMVSNSNGADTVTQVNFIQVYPSPSADAGSDQTGCEGEDVLLGGKPTGSGGTGFLRYNWAPGNSLNSATLANPTADPADTTIYTVTVSDDNGCTAVDSVTINVLPAPVLDIDVGESVSACEGDTLPLVNIANNPAGTTYLWSPKDFIGDPTSDSTFVVVSEAVTEYTLAAQSPAGCKASTKISITVLESPTVEAGQDQFVCGSESVELGGEPTATGGAGGYTYLWQPFAGLNNSGAANPMASPSGTTTYTVQVFDAVGCSSSDTVKVEVAPKPLADAGADQGPICAGEEVTLGGNPTGSGGTGNLRYTWRPTASIDSITNANPTATPETTTTFSVIVVDENGCRTEDSAKVEVWPSPTADAGADSTLCGAGDITLGGNPAGSGGTGQLSYAWEPAGLISPSDQPNPVINVANSTTFTLTVTDANQCTDVDSITIAVIADMEIDAGAGDTLCFGECAVLGGTPTAQGGSGSGYAYEWTVDGSLFANGSNPEVCPAETKTYQLRVIDPSGCAEESAVTIEVKPFQPIEFSTIDSSYCENDDADTLVAFPVGGSFSGNGVTGNNFDPGQAGVGTHFVFYEYQTGNGCNIRDSFQTEVHPNPLKPLITKVNDTLFTDPGYFAYEWLYNGIKIPNTNNYFYRPSQPGSYRVRVFNEHNCSRVSDAVDFNVGIKEIWRNTTVKVFPNPSEGNFIVELTTDRAQEVRAEIMGVSGKILFAENWSVQDKTYRKEINLSGCASGIYMLRLVGEEGQLTKRLILQK